MRKRIKRTFILSALIVLLFVASLIYIYGNYDFLPGQSGDGLRGVRIENPVLLLIKPSEIKQIKESGFNTVLVSPKGYFLDGKVYNMPFTSTLIGVLAKKVHANGLKLALQPELVVLSHDQLPIDDRLPLDFLISWYQSWAEIAARANIEYLFISPSSYCCIAREKQNDWLLETLKEIKTYYRGKTGLLISSLYCRSTSGAIQIQLLCLEKSLTGRTVSLYFPEVKGFDFVAYELYPPPEAKNLSLFVVDAGRLDKILRKYALRKGLGEIVYTGINLPLYGVKDSSLLNIPLATKEEQKIYLEKMLSFLLEKKQDFIIYAWDSEAFCIDLDLCKKMLSSKKK